MHKNGGENAIAPPPPPEVLSAQLTPPWFISHSEIEENKILDSVASLAEIMKPHGVLHLSPAQPKACLFATDRLRLCLHFLPLKGCFRQVTLAESGSDQIEAPRLALLSQALQRLGCVTPADVSQL